MKGISPVITTVLLLLMGVAAIGSSWIFIQRIQSSTTAAGSSQFENIKGQASTAISVDLLTVTDNTALIDDILAVKLANPSAGISKVTRIVVKNSTGSSLSNITTIYVSANSFSDMIVAVSNVTDVKTFCPTSTFLRVTIYSDAFVPVRDYPIECVY
ncbi:MAG: hypothetical protein GOV01_00980 [Candidatus Altiarchaeota archaeon]|nr:hypothetical protein [Candidatus Altiarchaeota archaeon]